MQRLSCVRRFVKPGYLRSFCTPPSKDPRVHAIFMEEKLLEYYPSFENTHLPDFLRSSEEDLIKLNIKDTEARNQLLNVIKKTKGDKKQTKIIKTKS